MTLSISHRAAKAVTHSGGCITDSTDTKSLVAANDSPILSGNCLMAV